MAGLIFLLLSCIACARSPMLPDDTPSAGGSPLDTASDELIDLRVGASVALPGTTSTVTFVRVISDSRCPKGVQCFWEGDAVVELRVQTREGAARVFELHTNERFERKATVEALTLTVERLEPYPEKDSLPAADAYRLTLRLAGG